MNWASLRAFVTSCTALDIEPPASIIRGLELVDVIKRHEHANTGPVLTMTDDEIRDQITAISIREHDRDGRASVRGMRPGIDRVKDELAAEVRLAALPALEHITEQLRPMFDEHAAALVTAATEYGFTYATTSDDVINMADESASAAWRAVPKAWSAIAPAVSLRIMMSTLFDVSPTRHEVRAAAFPDYPRDEQTNYSVCFAASDNWSLARGYYVEGKTVGHLDWLALAAGGLHLNSPEEVRAKIEQRGILDLPAPGTPQLIPANDPLAFTYPTYPTR
jgi:hypothetical protein